MRYIGVQNMVDLVNDIGLETLFIELADYMERDYKRWEEFDKSARYATHFDDGVIELMPIADRRRFAFKYVNGHPKNFKMGLQTVTAFGVLSNIDSGYPILLSEMTICTALRTAAMSALAAKYLARENSKTMAVIGNGCQSEFQAIAFKALLGITNLRIYDIDPDASQKFMRNMEGKEFDIMCTKTAPEAVSGADIVTTVTADKQKATILSDNMIGEGMHINGIGGDCPGKTELQADILNRADVFVEFEKQTREEGEIQQMPEDFPVTELWKVFTGEKLGRASDTQITIFDSVGFALEDFSILRYLNNKIEDTDFYEELDLMALPEDPRDLFGLLL